MLAGGGGPAPSTHVTPVPHGPGPAVTRSAPRNETTEMVARVLGDTEDVWSAVFKAGGSRYEPPKLVLFRGGTRSACGTAR